MPKASWSRRLAATRKMIMRSRQGKKRSPIKMPMRTEIKSRCHSVSGRNWQKLWISWGALSLRNHSLANTEAKLVASDPETKVATGCWWAPKLQNSQVNMRGHTYPCWTLPLAGVLTLQRLLPWPLAVFWRSRVVWPKFWSPNNRRRQEQTVTSTKRPRPKQPTLAINGHLWVICEGRVPHLQSLGTPSRCTGCAVECFFGGFTHVGQIRDVGT